GHINLVPPRVGDKMGSAIKKTLKAKADAMDAVSGAAAGVDVRSEEHTSELQSRFDVVCRLLLEKKKPRTSWPKPRPWAALALPHHGFDHQPQLQGCLEELCHHRPGPARSPPPPLQQPPLAHARR